MNHLTFSRWKRISRWSAKIDGAESYISRWFVVVGGQSSRGASYAG